MKANCLDIGIVQAFLDGELSHSETDRVSAHIAVCDHCAAMLAEADEESAVVFSALEREFNTLVPTQRLWNRINDSLQAEHQNRPFWQKLYGFASLAFANPSIAAAASVIIVVGIFASVWLNRDPAATEIAAERPTLTAPAGVPDAPAAVEQTDVSERAVPPTRSGSFTVERASYRPAARPVARRKTISPEAVGGGYLPGEESYVRTISSLAKTVDEQKAGGVLRPSQLIAYERDMAVVDDAIAKMRKEVKRNPRNDSARQVLYSTYQNKIDMLSSVSQKQDLMVSMR